MKSIRQHLRVVSVYLLINIINYVLFPTISFALTSGPTTPEAFSFEPVDTSDLVNLQSGDFTYSIPVIDVPGPAGGYPVALSYHAGIQADQESSWVGLGWNLNPGSISRFVNNYPDDWAGVKTTVRDYWAGGSTTSNSFGVSYGLAFGPCNFASVSAEVTVSNDTYQGTGVGGSLGAFVGAEIMGGNGSAGLHGSVGLAPYGGFVASAGLSAGVGVTSASALGAKASIGIGGSYYSKGGKGNKYSFGMHGGISATAGNTSLVGASISSSGSSGGATVGASVGGASMSQSNSKQGTISSFSKGFGIAIPTVVIPGLNLTYSRSYVRYWSDESETVYNYGSLNNWMSTLSSYYDTRSFDIFDVGDFSQSLGGNDDYNSQNDTKGTFLDYDVYSVQAQGIGGNIRPYFYKAWINRRNIYDNNGNAGLKNYILDNNETSQLNPAFRFTDEFSNKLILDDGSITLTSGSNPIDISQDASPIAFEATSLTGPTPKVSGSRRVVYKTNYAMSFPSQSAGILETKSSGFVRNISGDLQNQIGSFIITNPSGVSYHFSLPAYAYDEHVFSQNIVSGNGNAWNHYKKQGKYAYTWHLTAVTGPDFVDRAPYGQLGDEDWGYWVEFDYGLWSSDFKWRIPALGFNEDINNNYKTFSRGKKEIYYLDAIRTKSHVAYFIKDTRFDARAENTDFSLSADIGGFDSYQLPCNQSNITLFRQAAPSAKLSRIVLLDRENDNIVKNDGSSVYGTDVCGNTFWKHDYYTLTESDISSGQLDKSLKEMAFAYDYSLCKQAPNSYLVDGELLGKLTLRSLTNKGKAGQQSIPPTTFGYELENEPVYQKYFYTNANRLNNYTGLSNGDLLRIWTGSLVGYYVYYLNDFGSYTQPVLKKITGDDLPNGAAVSLQKTKNPPYVKDQEDIWGFFKSDYTATNNNNLDKLVSEVSAKNVDVWSLRKITSPTGLSTLIEYESDTYNQSVLSEAYPILLSFTSYNNAKLTAELKNYSGQLSLLGDLKLRAFYTSTQYKTIRENGTEVNIPFNGAGYFDNSDPYIISQNGTTVVFGNVFAPPTGEVFKTINLGFKKGNFKYGGGTRVKSISLNDEISNTSSSTYYNYEQPAIANSSSGNTPYEPITMDPVLSTLSQSDRLKVTQASVDASFGEVLSYSRFIPGPGVTYEYVTVTELTNGLSHPASSRYNFQVFDRNMISLIGDPNRGGSLTPSVNWSSGNRHGLNYQSSKAQITTLKNYSAAIGTLKSVKLIGPEGDVISETKNNYLFTTNSGGVSFSDYDSNLQKFGNQGKIMESYAGARIVKNDVDDFEALGTLNTIVSYPNVKVSEEHYNYRTGTMTKSYYSQFDQLSGEPTQVVNQSANGKFTLVSSKPAFRVYPSSTLKAKNQLQQVALTETFTINKPTELTNGASTIVASGADLNSKIYGVIGAEATTWSNSFIYIGTTASEQMDNFRQKGTWTFIGNESNPQQNDDNTYKIANYSTFNFNNESINTDWLRSSEITTYDINSHALEAKDVNSQFAATRLDVNFERVIATAANTTYNGFTHSSFENNGDGGIIAIGQSASVNYAHSGKRVMQLNSSNTKAYFNITNVATDLAGHEKLLLSYWVAKSSPANVKPFISINGGADQLLTEEYGTSKSVVINGVTWYQQRVVIDKPTSATNATIGVLCSYCEIDDFRFQPLQSVVTAYAYNEWGELSEVLDNNNLFTRYEYDEMGRLKRVFSETFQYGVVKKSENTIHYANQN